MRGPFYQRQSLDLELEESALELYALPVGLGALAALIWAAD